MKKTISALLVLTMLLSLCACGLPANPVPSTGPTGQTGPSESTDTTPNSDPVFTAPTTEVTEPTTEATEPTTEVTEPADTTGDTEPTETDPCRHEYSRHETAASCTQSGLIVNECTLCGEKTTEEIPATGHRLTDPTCLKAKTCAICGVTDGNALGHSYENGKCTRCGAKMPTQELPADCIHDWSIQQTAPGCTAAGSIVYSCTKCGHQFSETIPANGHRFTDATCTDPQLCTVCNATQGSSLGHSFKDGACGRCGEKDPSIVSYKVTVRSDKGKPVEGVTVTIYTTGTTPAAIGRTDSKGVATMVLAPHTSYDIVLSDVPSQFRAKERYTFTYHIVNINLTTIPTISPTDHSQANYKVGSIMGDFTLTDTDGITYTLSELLKEKKLIILDFWFVNCGPCKSEFPYFESIYQKYDDNVQLLTLDPFDSEAAIKVLREDMGVTFPMIRDTINLHAGFGVDAYPTTVFIDSNGKILKIEKGAFPSEQDLIDVIERYLK